MGPYHCRRYVFTHLIVYLDYAVLVFHIFSLIARFSALALAAVFWSISFLFPFSFVFLFKSGRTMVDSSFFHVECALVFCPMSVFAIVTKVFSYFLILFTSSVHLPILPPCFFFLFR